MAKINEHLPGDCRPIAHILSRVGDKWTILLLNVLGDNTMRFKDLHRAVPGISQRMLTVTLRNLERDGLVRRTIYPTIPPKVEYALSDRGRSLRCALVPIADWVTQNRDGIEESQQLFDNSLNGNSQSPEPARYSMLTSK
ncbi:winged helix-turn-helix transcriptional regulator [Rhizobium sp. LjRoot254]|uniref:winged helix-turn-helix transcriptional regulator n=1 Tax=Rhizobium sp. LjRoot254 TaxID=3342297 RepID=UPI003ECEB5AC